MPTLTREELHELVWTVPLRTLGPRFGVSGVWMKKVCAALAIPVPERGYWAKRQAGKLVPPKALPPRRPGMNDTWSHGPSARFQWPPNPAAELAEPIPNRPVFTEPLEAVEATIRKRIGRPQVRPLSQPHPAIRALIEKDEKRREKQRNATYSFIYENPYFDSGFEQRRLRFLNSLFLALARADARPGISDPTARDLGVGVGVERVGFTFDHPTAKRDLHGRHQVRPGKADTLRLEIECGPRGCSHRRTWEDSDGHKIEADLADIAACLVLAGEAHFRLGRFAEYEGALKRRVEMEAELLKQQAEAARAERARLEKEARERRELLFSQATQWRQAADLRAFIAEVEREARDGKLAPERLASWTAWASAEAEQLDPLNSRDFWEAGDRKP